MTMTRQVVVWLTMRCDGCGLTQRQSGPNDGESGQAAFASRMKQYGWVFGVRTDEGPVPVEHDLCAMCAGQAVLPWESAPSTVADGAGATKPAVVAKVDLVKVPGRGNDQ